MDKINTIKELVSLHAINEPAHHPTVVKLTRAYQILNCLENIKADFIIVTSNSLKDALVTHVKEELKSGLPTSEVLERGVVFHNQSTKKVVNQKRFFKLFKERSDEMLYQILIKREELAKVEEHEIDETSLTISESIELCELDAIYNELFAQYFYFEVVGNDYHIYI